MMPASTTDSGETMSNVPDVCNTPSASGVTPITYVNTEGVDSADETCDTVQVDNKDTVHTDSYMSSSSGDEAGSSGGVVSGSNTDEVNFSQGSSAVEVDGYEWVYCGATTEHNGSSANTTGNQISPSQTTVMISM
jgi:hypothetical protein